MNKLFFFDINGTLIERDERTDLPFSYAIDNLLKIENAMKDVDTSARSDHDVFKEILSNHNIEYSENLWNSFLDLYIIQLEKFKKTDVWRINVDALEFVQYLSDKKYHLALITGELSIGAQYKLEKLNLWQYFKTGGYGEDGLKRFEIAEAALKKSKEVFPDDYDEIIIIGDTVLDIQTARHIGAKVISITTGSHSKEKLNSMKPDFIVDLFEPLKIIY
ncbi:MAG: HAD hydrolase-like protein [Clostridia bacterium]|nr:HAD hydrolase-like protein [Clostridia bacterium]